MADPNVQSNVNESGERAAGAARRTADAAADAARKGADAAAGTARAGIDAEQRSFATAADASRQSAEAMGRAAQTSIRAGQDMARHGQDMARRAGDQAADFWRTSLTPMAQLQGEVGRWFEQLWRQAAPSRMQGGLPLAMMSPFTGHPLADMRETDRGFELCVDLPGLKPEDVDLAIQGDALVLSGEKSDESSGGQGAYRFAERRFGRFERSFPLPPGVDRSRIEARFQDGVLRIDIPASPEIEQAQRIEVKDAQAPK